MGSNPGADGIYISTGSNYTVLAKTDISQSTISGIVSIKSGSTLNIKSAGTFTYATESNLVGTTATTWDHTSTGNVAINGARIDLN